MSKENKMWINNRKGKIVIRCLMICLMIFSFFLSYTWKGGYCIGDAFLTAVGLKAWSNGIHGTHYTVFYSFGILLISFFVYAWTTNKKFMTFLCFLCGFFILFFFANIMF